MDPVLAVAIIGCLGVGMAIVLLVRKLTARPETLPVSVDWITDLSASRYRPMQRLLSEDDYQFLASHPACDRRTLRGLRLERRRLFRGYLACLSQDFSRVVAALRLLMTYSAHDRPDLARILFTQQTLFAVGMLAVQWRLALHACGVGTVDVSGLVRAMECMRLELRQLVPVENLAA